MTKIEKDALLSYIDCRLMSLCKAVEPFIDSTAISVLYENINHINKDLEDTFSVDMLLKQMHTVVKEK